MLQDRLGVSPSPLVGKTQDSKDSANLKDLRGSAENKSELKRDFESALKEKLQKQKSDLEKKKELSRKEELRAEQKEKSSRGTKKKTTEVDEKMVSNGMASRESVVETPEAKNPAEIKVSSSENSNKIESKEKSASASVETAGQVSIENSQPAEQELNANPALSEANLAPEASIADLQMNATELQSPEAKAQPDAVDVMRSLEAELAEASGYKSQVIGDQSKISEMKNLEAKPTELKAADASAQAFEKNVLWQLQRENAFQQQSQFGDSSSQSDAKSGDRSELKNELSLNEMHQASGQSHSSFKTHLQGATEANVTAQMSNGERLEANREANINEIMGQAQYLVKKGGGEVNVKMSPDGLGEVNLKVQLINGQLSIEMQTTDKDVKKLIEDSLSDLKSGLAAHRLSLEHVKIDTVNATNTENNSSQTQSNLHQQNSNDQASRDLWMGMQQQSQQRSSHNRAGDFSLNPRLSQNVATPKATAAQAVRTYGGTKGATINRVA